jgi:hypothetical protein
MFLFLSVSFPLLMERCLLSMDIRICLLPSPTISSNKEMWDVLRNSCGEEIIMAVSWAYRNYTLIMF